MDITEYVNQEDPKRRPNVYLQKDDVVLRKRSHISGRETYEVEVKAFPEFRYSVTIPNIRNYKGEWMRVYTTDGDGNEKKMSVFLCKLDYGIFNFKHDEKN